MFFFCRLLLMYYLLFFNSRSSLLVIPNSVIYIIFVNCVILFHCLGVTADRGRRQ
uniref:Uncharacterized protein n=1 Tax=Octopus bimaculoides TaxID=37653 RepID=A0A0L8GIE1_OCTBM